MARRMAERRASQSPPPMVPAESSPSREVRDVVAAAYEELDAGELSFALAEPASDTARRSSADSWRPVELGQMARAGSQRAAPRSLRGSELLQATESRKPDTKDGPPPVARAGASSPSPPRPDIGTR